MELIPRSGDGGVDVIATKPGMHSIRLVDQVKAYKRGHKVTAKDVRDLVSYLTTHQNVSKGIVTTTSLFAPGIESEFKDLTPHRLQLVDGPCLAKWLTEVATEKS